MTEIEKNLLEDFRGLLPENKSHLLTLAHVTKEAQENTMKLYGITSPAEAATWGDRLAEPGLARPGKTA
jgi:hypothetical protein